ncbi:hypothetical protein [Pararhizobium gei]|nr:hypothetical protein [Rhizobium gei]
MENYVWLFAIIGGTTILGLALAYGTIRQHRLSAVKQQRQDDKVDQLYKR